MILDFVDKLKEPVVVGCNYLVPCVIRDHDGHTFITPVINHPHNDKENGQPDPHYHVDYRFVKTMDFLDGQGFPVPVNKHSKHFFAQEPRISANLNIEYIVLPAIRTEHLGSTDSYLIRNSKLKHRKIHKGKCPHRGYDLSSVKPVDGVIKCPLHGLCFNEKTKEIIVKYL